MTSKSTRRKLINDESILYFANLPPNYRKQLIAIYNEIENKKEVSLPRVAVALNLKYNIPVAGVENYINNRGIEFRQQQIAERESKARNLELLAQAERRKLASIALENEMKRMSEKSKQRKQYRKAKRARAVERAKNKKKNLVPVIRENEPYYLRSGVEGSRIIGNSVSVNIDDDMRADIEIIPQIMNIIIEKLLPKIPRGFKYSLVLKGIQYKGDEFVKSGTFLNSNMTSNINSIERDMRNSGSFDMPSEYYWLVKKISLHYELGQGGDSSENNKLVGYDKYKVYSPKTKGNCGKSILKRYGLKAEEGFLSIAYMRSKLEKLDIPVVEYAENKYYKFDEFVMLKDKHYYQLINSKVFIQRKKEAEAMKSVEQIIANKKSKIDRKKDTVAGREVLVYDIESKKDEVGYQIPKVIGYCSCEKSFEYKYGDDCVDEFVDMILKGNKHIIVGYNCGKYDYILIREALIKAGCGLEEQRRSLNGVMKCTATYKDEITGVRREYVFIDLLNFTNGSLRDNLKSYGCQCAKGEIDYTKIGYDDSNEFKDQLIEYLKADVLGTYQLMRKIDEPFLEKGISITDGSVYTLSQVAFKILNQYWKKAGILQGRVPKKVDEASRKSAYGGRCEVFKRVYKSVDYDEIRRKLKKKGETVNIDEIKDYMRALDVNSLYPYVMKDNFYPTGDAIFTGHFQKDKLGIYLCDVVKPKDLEFPVVNDKVYNSYNLIDTSGCYYTSVDIIQMRKHGYKVEITNGYYWKEQHKIFEDYINEYYHIKQNAKKGTPAYNNAKLMLNAVFGKCLQGDDIETNYLCQNEEDLVAMYKGKNQEDFCVEYEEVGGNIVGFYTHIKKKTAQDLTDKKAFVGAFILSYSKQEMYEKLLVSNPYYTDTDSIYCEAKYSEHFKIGKELGEYSDDVDGKIIYAVFVAKKLKYVEYINAKGELVVSITGKGCYKPTLNRKSFTNMLAGLEVENKNPNRFIRNLKQGSVKVVEYISRIKMNSSNRLWNGNNSTPIIE